MDKKKLLMILLPCGLTAIILVLALILSSVSSPSGSPADTAPEYTTPQDSVYLTVDALSESPDDISTAPGSETLSTAITEDITSVTDSETVTDSDTLPETEPPVTKPPETTQPVTRPPETKPPETKPPVTKPPETKPPETKPPVTKPPVTKPPETKPPETKPAVQTDPPVEFNGHILTSPLLDEERYVLGDILDTSPVKYIDDPDKAFPDAHFTRKYMTRNDSYWYENQRITVHGVMIHSTASPGIMAPQWFDRWNRSKIYGEIGRDASVHAFVDDENICQYLPWNHRAWHSRGIANNYFIGIEICEPASIKYTNNRISSYDPYSIANIAYFKKAYGNAVDLAAQLCFMYGLNADDVISHKEGWEMDMASNHGDPDHWFKLHGLDMDDFRDDVEEKLKLIKEDAASKVTTPAQTIPPATEPSPITTDAPITTDDLTSQTTVTTEQDPAITCTPTDEVSADPIPDEDTDEENNK